MNSWERILVWEAEARTQQAPLTLPAHFWKAAQNTDPLLASVSPSLPVGWAHDPQGWRHLCQPLTFWGPEHPPRWGPSVFPICFPPGLATYLSSRSLQAPLLDLAIRALMDGITWWEGWGGGEGTNLRSVPPPLIPFLGLQQDKPGPGKRERKSEQMRAWSITNLTSNHPWTLEGGDGLIPDRETEAQVTVWDLPAQGWICSRWASHSRIGRTTEQTQESVDLGVNQLFHGLLSALEQTNWKSQPWVATGGLCLSVSNLG